MGSDWTPAATFLQGLPSLMRLASLPGLSMAVLDRGSLAWSGSYGVLSAVTREPVLEHSLFEAASMSKPVFAYAVLKLVDQGHLDLDRPLVSYCMPPYLPDDPLIRQISARHALTHSTGFPDWADEQSPETFRPKFAPGTRFSYSGEGFFWLQLVVERITRMGFDRFMRMQLFEPAGMMNSTYSWDEAHARVASFGHRRGRVVPQDRREVLAQITPLSEEWGRPIRDWTHEDWLQALETVSPRTPQRKRSRYVNSAGSLLTNANDYARFLTLMMNRPPRASWEISETARRSMLTPQIEVQPRLPFWWSLGWMMQQCDGGWRVSHEGNNDNRFTCYAGADVQHGRGLVILTNGDRGFALYQRIVREATGLDQLSFIADVMP